MINFKDFLTEEIVAQYLKAEWGTWLSVSPQGKVYFSDGSIEIEPSERAIAKVKCPGINNISEQDFSCEENSHMRSIAQKIDDTLENGDLSSYIEEIAEKLEESMN